MSRSIDDLPPVASDQDLIDWAQTLNASPSPEPIRVSRPNRPLVATRINRTMSTDEIFLDISERAAAVYERRRVSARRSALAGRTSTS